MGSFGSISKFFNIPMDNNSIDRNSFGPLPRSGKTNLSERNSDVAFNEAFPRERFRLRRVEGDTGVDWTIEAILDDHSDTNCLSQVQLKSTEKYAPNKDGSVSYEVKVANLNYLRNGFCPLYILWIKETDELRYAWVKDIIRKFEETNPHWQEQIDVTIRFSEIIDKNALEHIFQRIIAESRMGKDIREMIARSTESQPSFIVDSTSLKITDPTTAKQLLLGSGRRIVLQGYPDAVVNLYKILDVTSQKHPSLLLVKAYAEVEMGEYDSARSALKHAIVRRDELTESESCLLDWLHNLCEYFMRHKNTKDYVRDFEAINQRQSGISKLIDSLNIAFIKFTSNDEIASTPLTPGDMFRNKKEITEQIRSIVKEINEHPKSSELLIQHAAAVLLTSEGQNLVYDFMQQQSRMSIAVSMKVLPRYQDFMALHATGRTFVSWQKAADDCISKAIALGDVFLYCDTVLLLSNVVSLMYSNLFFGGLLPEKFLLASKVPSVLRVCIDLVENAIKHLERAGIQEKRIRAIITLMDMYEMIGENEKSCQLAKENLAYVRTMCAPAVITIYENHFFKTTPLAKKRGSKHVPSNQEGTGFLAKVSDAELSEMAEEMSAALSLPKECMHRELIVQRKLAEERVHFCKYLQLLQCPTEPTLGPIDYSIVCNLHKYGEAIIVESRDYEKVFVDFKETHCLKCSDQCRLEVQ